MVLRRAFKTDLALSRKTKNEPGNQIELLMPDKDVHGPTGRGFDRRECPSPWIQGLASEPAVDAFWLHPFGDLCKSVEAGSQSSFSLVYFASTAGIGITEC